MATLTESKTPSRTALYVVGAVAAAALAFAVVGAAASDGSLRRTDNLPTYVTGQTANVGPSVSDYPASR